MIRIGIVGSIGSGKSYISKLFGCPVFNADAEVASLYKKSMWAFITLKPNCIKEDSSKLLGECDKLLLKARLLS